ncbi:MAG: hypothetical protein LBE83_04970 [Propionibacteriaceae bacterium]|jgi:hypothetical protein|nr:hypothetical protein [Propionibacteriaceae bacterium]
MPKRLYGHATKPLITPSLFGAITILAMTVIFGALCLVGLSQMVPAPLEDRLPATHAAIKTALEDLDSTLSLASSRLDWAIGQGSDDPTTTPQGRADKPTKGDQAYDALWLAEDHPDVVDFNELLANCQATADEATAMLDRTQVYVSSSAQSQPEAKPRVVSLFDALSMPGALSRCEEAVNGATNTITAEVMAAKLAAGKLVAESAYAAAAETARTTISEAEQLLKLEEDEPDPFEVEEREAIDLALRDCRRVLAEATADDSYHALEALAAKLVVATASLDALIDPYRAEPRNLDDFREESDFSEAQAGTATSD